MSMQVLYGFDVQARSADAFASGEVDQYGPVSKSDRAIFTRYAAEMSELLRRQASESELQRKHQELILQLSMNGFRQINVGAYALALHECQHDSDELACAYAAAMKAQATPEHREMASSSSAPSMTGTDHRQLAQLADAARYVKQNVRGIKASDIDLLTRMISLSDQLRSPTWTVSAESLWVQGAEAYAQISAGGRMLLNERMKANVGVTAEHLFESKLSAHGRTVTMARTGGCGSTIGFVAIMASLLILLTAWRTRNVRLLQQ